MPSRQVHDAATTLIAIVAVPICLHYGVGVPETIAICGGCLTGIPLTPDLDLAENRRYWSLWNLYWKPYGKFLNHRSPLSHWPILGTIGRLLYLIPLWLPMGWELANRPVDLYAFRFYVNLFEWWIAGLFLVDGLHWFMDKFVTGIRRRF